jgi:hypothetical protein
MDYEEIRDENADHPDVQERANYHGYLRRELPPPVRSCLESAVSSQFQALADALRTQPDEIIQGCIDQLLMDYETAQTTTNADSNRRNCTTASYMRFGHLSNQCPPKYFAHTS